jgi:hypothetical protein
MKVNEFKKIEEGFFSDLTRVGSDVVSSIPKSRVSSAEVQKRLLKDFIEDLLVDLDAAIKGGRVGVGISSAASANASAVQTSQQTAQPASTTQQTAQQTAQPQQAVQPTNTTRQAAQQRSAQRKTLRQPAKPIDREEELAGVADLGYNESYSYSSFLNTLVESYISEQQQMSIASWIMLWFAAYMKGVDWKGDKAGVETIAKEIESSYKKDRGKAAIQKLGSRAWDLIKTSGGVAPAGATQPKDDDLGTDIKTALSTQSSTQSQAQPDPDPEVENLKKALSSVSPEELATIRNELVKKSGTA